MSELLADLKRDEASDETVTRFDDAEIQAALDAVAENADQDEDETSGGSGGDGGPYKVIMGFAHPKKQRQLYDRLRREELTVKMVTL